MTARARRIAAAIAVAVLAGAGLPLLTAGPASAATADAAECAPSFLAQGGYTLFDIDTRFVPPPLRGTGWDCASRITDRPLGDGVTSNQFTLLWVGISSEDAIRILERFETFGWTTGDETIVAENTEGRSVNQPMRASELRGWDPLPASIITRFSHAVTGQDIVEFEFAGGGEFVVDPALDGPVLRIDVDARDAYDATGFADPSVMSSLRTIAEAVPSGTQVAVLGGSAVFLMLIVGFPGFLLNKVLDKRWSRFIGWLRARRMRRVTREPKPEKPVKAAKNAPAPAAAVTDAVPPKRRPSWLVWPGFVAAAVISGFVDPSFGPNPMSVRLLLTALLSFALLNVVGWGVVMGVLRRIQPSARPHITFRWGSLIVVALTVLIARLLQFEPGIVFGLVAGLTFAVSLVASRDALVILLGSSTALVIALLAWVGYSAFAPVARAVPGNWFFVAVSEFFSGVTVEGISTLPLALLPLLALDGAVLFAWRKWVWAIAYAVGVAAFVFVMFTIPESWREITGGFGRWLLLFVGLAVVAVGVWVTDTVIERRAKALAAAQSAAPPASPPPPGAA
ncbi:hypothetical protein [Protaetiibacter larvae]|uniref:Uncharacterized protein n=1 Tax=Protaetiibacter larvae TaxID=2592654 RepID=A0A5C1Y9V1_9MICO|nr:hypothetical protein [Protaetiibacter larvae]QEO10596.1 hypothetical protein FLP23_11640 [Protaetiibacter larvae]